MKIDEKYLLSLSFCRDLTGRNAIFKINIRLIIRKKITKNEE